MVQLLSQFRGAFLTIAFFSLVINLLMLAPPLYMLQIFSRVLNSRSNETLLMLFLLIMFALMISGWLDAIRAQLLNRLANAVQRFLRLPAIETQWQWSRLMQAREQSLEDVQIVATFFSQPVRAFFDMPWFPVFLIIIYLFHPLLALVTTIGAAIMLGLAIIEEWVEKQALAEPSGAKARAKRFLREVLANGESVVGLGMRNRAIQHWLRLHDDYLSAHERAADSTSRISGIAQVTRRLIPSVGLTIAVWLVINTPDMSPGIMIASSILMGQALAPIGSVISAWKAFVRARQAYDRLQSLISDYPQQMATRDSRLNLPRPTGMIALERVHLVFKDRLVLSNITFRLDPGESLGVVGLNAAGKTSLIRLLAGIFPPSSGRVTLDGADVYPWAQADLGQYLGYLPQQIELFTGTVAENIARLGEVSGSEAEIIQAARLARVHELIMQLPKGYDTEIGEGGRTFSGGQRQLLALARALYGNPALVILDEPNASLDGPGELRLLETLRKLKTMGLTVVVVSHKSSVLKDMDKLLVLNQGRQMHFGPRSTVLEILSNERSVVPLHPGPDDASRFPRRFQPKPNPTSDEINSIQRIALDLLETGSRPEMTSDEVPNSPSSVPGRPQRIAAATAGSTVRTGNEGRGGGNVQP
jgi:PrtD family type I secretion system ABC transporter